MPIVMNQASVGTTASLIGYIPPAGYLIASGTAAVYLGTGTAVTTGNGYQVTSSAPLVWQNALAAPAVPVYAIASSTAATLSFSFGNGPAGQVIAGGTAALQLDRNAADIQPVGGTAAAGSTGLAADAGHVHVGFTNPLTTKGDLLYESGAGTASRLAVGGSTQVLGVSAGAPAWVTGMTLLTATGTAGTTLVNGTATILSWTAPADGNLHRFQVFSQQYVTSAETGGAVGVFYVLPNGTVVSSGLFNGGSGTGVTAPAATLLKIVAPGAAVSLSQTTALAGGTAVLWAELWGS